MTTALKRSTCSQLTELSNLTVVVDIIVATGVIRCILTLFNPGPALGGRAPGLPPNPTI